MFLITWKIAINYSILWMFSFNNVDYFLTGIMAKAHICESSLESQSQISPREKRELPEFKLSLFTYLSSGRQLPKALQTWIRGKSVMTKELILVKTNGEANWSNLSSCEVHYYTMVLCLEVVKMCMWINSLSGDCMAEIRRIKWSLLFVNNYLSFFFFF